jgi:hypothetical protein
MELALHLKPILILQSINPDLLLMLEHTQILLVLQLLLFHGLTLQLPQIMDMQLSQDGSMVTRLELMLIPLEQLLHQLFQSHSLDLLQDQLTHSSLSH